MKMEQRGIYYVTGEAPGTNRFEIVGDLGKIVVENEKLIFYRLAQSEREFNATYTGGFGEPEFKKVEIPVKVKMAIIQYYPELG